MAETLTMEPNVEKTSIDNLSAEEQDSLQVGEQMQEAQDNLLAGKYKNAEELKGVVGGEANYANMIDWAQKSLNEQEVKMFDAVMERGDPLAAFFAVRSLAYAYNDAVGYDGNMVQGKAPRQSNDQFRSQAEVIAAMGDPRYENDPAYRRDIMENT